MPIDPRNIGTPPASPGDTPSLSPAIVAGLIQVNADLNRRVAALEAARTQIGAQTITAGTTGMLKDGSIVASSITAGNVVASIMTANAVNAGHINASSIRASVLSATAIVADGLQAQWLSATQAAVGTLAAITSNMGSITAGSITGATIQTAVSGSRTVMDSSGLRGYALDGVTKVFEINTGTGIASFTGLATLSASSVVPGGTISGDNTVPGSRIVSASVNTLQLNAGAVTANIIAAGAITAQKLSIAGGVVVPIPNGMFSDSNPADGTTLAGGWAMLAGGFSAATVQTDTTWGRTARITHGATVATTADDQDVLMPVGRHIIRGWLKTTSIVGTGARVSAVTGGTATATLTGANFVTGTTGWTLLESVADVTVAGTVRIRLNINNSSGTAEFANVHVVSTVSNTHLGPDSVTTDKILANTILASDIFLTGGLSALSANLGTISAGTITGATFQTAVSGARTVLDASGLNAYDASAVNTFSINSSGAVSLTGTVYAKTGLSMDAGTVASPANANRLRMLDGSSNPITAYYGTSFSSIAAAYIESGYNASSYATADLYLRAIPSSGLTNAPQIQLHGSTTLVNSNAVLSIGSYSLILLNGSLKSDFVTSGVGTARGMALGSQSTVSVTVPAGGSVNGTISAPPVGGTYQLIGELAGTNAGLVSWGRTSTTNVQFYNYHPTVSVTLSFNYFWMTY